MLITATTSNVPGQMAPSYAWSRPIGLLWCLFYLYTLYFILYTLYRSRPIGLLWCLFYLCVPMLVTNVTLATVYNGYSGRLKEETLRFFTCFYKSFIKGHRL